jgi:hypothetical protein
MAGEEVFGSQKRKANIPLGFEGESHWPDKVNFSHLRIATRSSSAKHVSCNLHDVMEELSPELQEDQPFNNRGTAGDVGRPGHVTFIHEIACKEMEWHIPRLPKTSAKAWFAQQAITKKKYEARIVQGKKPTAAPTKMLEVMELFFYNDDIERCIKGTRRKWGQLRPDIPSIWPMKIGTNLSTKEIFDLESAGFQLPQHAVISLRRLFGMEELPINLTSFLTPASTNDCPKTRSGKSIRMNNNAPYTKQANSCASSLTLKGQIHKVTMIPHPGYACIVTLDSRTPPKVQQYLITIGTFPECSCEYFKDMATKPLGNSKASLFYLYCHR